MICVFRKKTDRGGASLRGQEEDEHDSHHETPIAYAVGNKRFLRGVARFLQIGVEADEQVGTEPDSLPTDKHQEEIVSQHQRQHREHEQIQVGKEAIEAGVAAHVADRKDVNQEPDERHEERIRSTQTIHRQAEVGAKLPDLNPGPEMIEDGSSVTRFAEVKRAAGFESEVESDNRGNCDRSASDEADEFLVAQPAADKPVDGCAARGAKMIRLKRLFPTFNYLINTAALAR